MKQIIPIAAVLAAASVLIGASFFWKGRVRRV